MGEQRRPKGRARQQTFDDRGKREARDDRLGDLGSQGAAAAQDPDDADAGDKLPDETATRMSLEGLETFDAEVERAAEDSPLLESEARRFVGAPAFTPDGDELGVVQDLVMERDGVVQGLVLDVGSFLGLSERQVSIDWDEIIISADGRVIVDMAVEDIQQLPPYRPS